MKGYVTKMFVAGLMVALVAGCAMGPKGPTDEELIKSQLDAWKAAIVAKDIDKWMAVYSENFYNAELGGKAELKDFLSQAIESGYLDDAQIDWSQAKFDIQGDTATVYPITISGAQGSVTTELTFKKEKAGKTANWMITGMNVEGA